MFQNTCFIETNPVIFIFICVEELTALKMKNQAKKNYGVDLGSEITKKKRFYGLSFSQRQPASVRVKLNFFK